MESVASGLSWGVLQRLEFIEFRLFWEGGINRGEITRFFSVSVPQASKDLSQYQELAPDNLRYDRSEKRYFVAASFEPVFLRPDADQYLAQLARVKNQGGTKNDSWLLAPPSTDTLPLPHRRVEVGILRPILAAIRKGKSVEIFYQSMGRKRSEPTWRGISPHAFGNDGSRWHVRAFCHIDEKFKDFLLSRCTDVRPLGAAAAKPEDDRDWSEYLDVILIPNPELGVSQRKAIELDFDMRDGKAVIPVRRALLFYFYKRLRLDIADILNNPYETPVVVSNRKDCDAALSKPNQ